MARARLSTASPFRGASHDHESCIDRALDRAAQLCEKRGARLTALRREVLALVWRGHEPVGAYAILDALRRSHPTAARFPLPKRQQDHSSDATPGDPQI